MLVAGADRERERDHRHEQERRHDAARAGALLARRVEAAAPEDEHGHEREERQPLRLGLPGQAPEHRPLAVVELAQDEREVERAGERRRRRSRRATAMLSEPARRARAAGSATGAPACGGCRSDGPTAPRGATSPCGSAPTRGLVATRRNCTRLAGHPVRTRSAALLLVLATALPRLARAAARAGSDSRVVHRQGRRLRPDVPRHRDVRLHPGPSVRLHAAALRLVPHPALLDLRPPLGGRRARADLRRRRDDADRLADRHAAGSRRRSACSPACSSRCIRISSGTTCT